MSDLSEFETDGGTDETNHNLNESNDKVRLSTKLKRGSGTRDQDTHTVKVRGRDAADAAERLDRVLAELRERDVFERCREVENGE